MFGFRWSPTLAASFCSSWARSRQLEAVPRVERHRRVAHAGLLHQRLGLLEILLALGDALVGRGEHRCERAVVADVGLAREEAVDQRTAVDGQRHRLSHALVVERLLVVAHVHLAVHRRAQLDHRDLRVVEQRPAAGRREVHENVDVAALQRQDLRLLLGIELDLLAVELRDPALVPVIGVLDVGDAGVRRVLVELPRAGAGERLLPLPAEVLRNDDRVVVVGADQVGEVAVRRVELEDHRARIGCLRRVLREHPGERRQRVGAALRVRQRVDRGRDVLRGHWRAVVELDALADLERPDAAVRVRLPALGQPRLELQLAVRPRQELGGLRHDAQAALVGHLERVDLGRRARGHAELQRAAGAHLDLLATGLDRSAAAPRAGAGLLTRAARAGQEPHGRERHPHHGAAPDEVAPAEVPGAVFVDEVVLEFAALRADRVDPAVRLVAAHVSSSVGVSALAPAYSRYLQAFCRWTSVPEAERRPYRRA